MSADGYALTVCSCDGGPYLGARKAGTPCCCEVCGFITPDQLAAIAEALGSSDDGVRVTSEHLDQWTEDAITQGIRPERYVFGVLAAALTGATP